MIINKNIIITRIIISIIIHIIIIVDSIRI